MSSMAISPVIRASGHELGLKQYSDREIGVTMDIFLTKRALERLF